MLFSKNLRFTFNPVHVRFVLAVLLLVILPITLGSETYRMTTYYPSPFASYQRTRILDHAAAGASRMVELGNVGPSNDLAIITPQIWSRNLDGSGGNIMLGATGGRITINKRIRNFCTWIVYGVNTSLDPDDLYASNAFCPTTHPYAVAMAKLVSGTCTLTSDSYISDNVQVGCMMCCRFSANDG
jgi:hypothetical protein